MAMTQEQRDAIDAQDKARQDASNKEIAATNARRAILNKKTKGTGQGANNAALSQIQRKKDAASLKTSSPSTPKEKVTQTAFNRSAREIEKNDNKQKNPD